ncbi:membrane-targeted effector domain-containing toxin [Pseudomonas sp. 14P_8.1_Bac3]|uniref:membrane-targeted effector domain-containing toxin n=1 Tax=Pseudomonas sp. 14P_8.1_Bac3 TaxID=2971621 RepID=UPI0021C77C89|nr:membrane-targeted effector domain-containing toxin [Pseudomonas sp. 14P_8.1_Bac3]MCU1761239.1 membrane-targeted effector domain-containing toxin [Pseudomonas sp. 14P_8.1_Bac3]
MDTTQDATLPNAADREALKSLVPTMVEACPDMYEMACAIARDILARHDLTHLAPEQVYFHRFRAAQSNPLTFTGWEHRLETPRESMTLPQLVIQRFSVHDQDNADLLDAYAGFYIAGPDAGTYDQTNEVRLHAKDVLKVFWEINFVDRYRKKIQSFWHKHDKTFRTLAKCTFLAKAMEDRERGRLSDENFKIVVNAVAGNVRWPVTRQMLEDEAPPAKGIRVSLLKIGGFVATDILCIVDARGRKMIYTPGEVWGVHALQSDRHVHWWVLSKIKKPSDRKRFMAHFQVADHDIMEDTSSRQSAKRSWLSLGNPGANLVALLFREPHIENVGLNHVLDLLTSTWHSNDHQLVEHSAEALNGDAFTFLAQATHARMISDAEFMMHSNGELRKKLWIGYLNAFNKMFGPMAAVGWPVALAVVGAGIANVGLQIDQAVYGKTPGARKSAVTAAIFTAIDTLFNATFLKGHELPEIAETSMLIEEEEHLLLADQARTPLPTLEQIAPKQVLPAAPEDFLASFKTTITEATLADSGHPKLQGIIQTPSGKHYIYMRRAAGDGFYQVRYVEQMRGWVIVDPAHPHSFYRNVPVRLNEALKWQPVARPGLRGGMKIFGDWPWGHTAGPLPETATPSMPYDVPPTSTTVLRPLAEARVEEFPLDSVHGSDSLYQDFKTLRRSLYDDAIDFYSAPNIPPRPAVPIFKPSTPFADMSKRLFKAAPGLVIGQDTSGTGARQVLIDNFKLLNKQKVRTLYVDHLLTDFHQADLDLFHRTGKMPTALEESLQTLDSRFGSDPTGPHSYTALVKAAQKNHIRVQAIDCMASRRFPRMERTTEGSSRKMMNYFSDTAIRADQAARGANRWVALVDEERASRFDRVAGVSELEGAVSLRVEELPVVKAGGLSADPGKKVRDLMGNPIDLLKSDLRLQLDAPPPTITATSLENALPRSGMFMIQDSATLIHRSGDGSLVHTQIQHDAGGFFIVRPRWSSVSGRHFDSVHELALALEDEGLSLRRVRIDPLAGPSPVREPTPSTSDTSAIASAETTLPDTALFRSPYEVPLPLRGKLKQTAVAPGDRTLRDDVSSFSSDSPVQAFKALRKKLHEAATGFYADLGLAQRPAIPTIDPASSAESFIDWWIEHFNGLVIGESHAEIGSKQWLIEQMPTLSRKGVKTLYMEHLFTDFHQAALDNFASTSVMPRDLELYLQGLDQGHMTDPSQRFNFLELVKEANRHGIRIQALDCMASYRLEGMYDLNQTTRQQMMNFYAHTVIDADQAVRGPHKWVALMGNSHANTYEGVTGVSELSEAVGLRIEDVAKGKSRGYEPDPGRTFVDDDDRPTGLAKSDLRLQISTPFMARSTSDIEQLLSRPGMYTLKREPDGIWLVHRGRDNLLARTPIDFESGRFYIERPAWPTLHRKRFDSMTALLDALNDRGMTPAS